MAKNKHEQSLFLESLREHPLVSVAAKRAGISRATIYRWIKDNQDFKAEVEKAQAEGRSYVVDIGESALFKKVREGNMDAIKFLLAHNDPRYRPLRSMLIEPLSAAERRELERLRITQRPIPTETMDSILKAFKNYGFLKEDEG